MAKTPVLLDWMRARGLDAYGSVITGEQVRAVADIIMPEVGTRKEFDQATLKELSAVGAVREKLLEEGKYLEGDHGDYRILLPSENAKQVDRYREEAHRKVKRAAKLERNTPSQPSADVHSDAQRQARARLLEDSIEADKKRAKMNGYRRRRPPPATPSPAAS